MNLFCTLLHTKGEYGGVGVGIGFKVCLEVLVRGGFVFNYD